MWVVVYVNILDTIVISFQDPIKLFIKKKKVCPEKQYMQNIPPKSRKKKH